MGWSRRSLPQLWHFLSRKPVTCQIKHGPDLKLVVGHETTQRLYTVSRTGGSRGQPGATGELQSWISRDEGQTRALGRPSRSEFRRKIIHTNRNRTPHVEAAASEGLEEYLEDDALLDEIGDLEAETQMPAPSTRASRDAEDAMLPKIMIVGRPNVGKSALFNRLTRRREALVYNTPDGHVTRDVREGIAKLAGLRFKVLDTAGLETFTEDESILARTAGISATALRKCQIALFLVDGRAGLQPQDTDVGKWLRKTAPHVKVVVALNKAEGIYNDSTGRLMAALGETHQLGFGDPTPISAESGEGMGDLYDTLRPLLEEAQAEILKNSPEGVLEPKEADDDSHLNRMPMQLAIAGRPNVGKSTLVNALLREERVLTGPEPGLTRDSVSSQFEYDGRKVRLVDTAGWMQRVQVKEGPAALSAMHARRGVMNAHIVALVLDGEEIANTRSSMRHAEAALARWVVQEGRALVVVVNKMDLLSGKENAKLRGNVMKAVPAEIQEILPQVSGVPIVFVSALEKKGSAAIMRNVFQCYEKWCTRLSTAQLNRWLRKVMSRHPKNTSGQGHGAKVKFMTQVKARPPTFVVFVSGVGELEDTDLRFLASALREDFGLDGIPLRILQRSTKK
ncbi:GTPase [Marchantia polymorpha subsp. ruderalis]